mgnify:CR=1 FL=1
MVRFIFGTALLALIFGVLQAWRPERNSTRASWRVWGLDLSYWVLQPTLFKPFSRLAGILVAVPIALLQGRALDESLADGFGPLAGLPIGAQVALVLVLADLVGTLWHRVRHQGGILWRIHAIHHSSRHLDWLAAARLHPLDKMLTSALQTLVLLPLGFDLVAVGAALPAFGFYGLFVHANVDFRFGWLRYLVATPAFHRWHHSPDVPGEGCNFAGLFPVWDLWMGTFHCPAKAPEAYGLRGDAPAERLWAQLTWPFRRRPVQG